VHPQDFHGRRSAGRRHQPPRRANRSQRSDRPTPASQPTLRAAPSAVVVLASAVCGSVPCSGLAARLCAGVDLRRVGTGTVSGTGLYDVAGFGPLAIAGSLDVAKGAVGPLLAGPQRPVAAAVAAAAAVSAHNWSPWLRGAGGRGLSPSIGALLVSAPEGAAVLLGGMAVGRLARQTALGTLVALLALPVVLARRRGGPGVLLGTAVLVPTLAKRLAGNGPAPFPTGPARLARLLFDRDCLRPVQPTVQPADGGT